MDPSLFVKNRLHSIVGFCQLRFCKNKIQLYQHTIIRFNRNLKLCRHIAEFCQYRFDFFLLLYLQGLQFIVEIDHSQRLDKYR